MVSINQIKQLREETDVSVTECKKALVQANGDLEKAKEILRKWGQDLSGKRIEKKVKEGVVHSYIHPNKKVGVLLEIRCESDFVARSEEFSKIAHEICLQIAAMKPLFLKEEDIPEVFLDGEKKIYQEQFKNSGKPQKIVDQIIDGKLKKYKEEISLLSQTWIKDDTKIIKTLLDDFISKTGENVVLRNFARYEI
jgi:elongation factor Ts